MSILLAYAQIVFSYLILGGIYGLVSVGLGIIWGVMNAINFAHGDFLMISMFIVFWLVVLLGLDPFLSLPIVVLIMVVIGGIIHRVAVEPVIEREPLMTILTTLGVSMVLESGALILWTPNPRAVPNIYKQTYLSIGPLRASLAEILAFISAIILVILVQRFLTRTKIGKQIRAVSQNPFGARALGINIERIRVIAFLLGAVIAGVAGVFLATFYPNITPYVGLHWSLFSFIVVVLAGLENIQGMFVSGLIIGLSEALGAILFTSAYRHLLVYLVFIIVLLVRPQGIFGKEVRRL